MAAVNPPKDNPGTTEARGVIQKIIASINKNKSLNLNVLFSLANPLLDNSADKAADRAKKMLPKQHWLRSQKGEAVLGVLGALIEEAAKKYPEPTQAALKKASDWVETFARHLHSNGPKATGDKKSPQGRDEKSPTGGGSSSPQTRLADGFRTRMEEATDTELDALLKRVKKEATTFAEVDAILTEGPPKPEKPEPQKEKHEPWTKRFSAGWNKFSETSREWAREKDESLRFGNNALSAKIDAMRRKNRERQVAKEPWRPGFIDKILLGPWKFLWRILCGFGKSRTERKSPGAFGGAEARREQEQQTKTLEIIDI